jgi:beta-glucosidase
MSTTTQFPADFIWGVAASAPQIEGAADIDGKEPSIWDVYCRIPGAVANGDTLDTSIDHYHRYESDFRLMRELGIRNYRLSISWPRIMPDGKGPINQRGIDFYRRILESLRRNGIRPWVNFYHGDLPQSLEEKHGGWPSRRIPELFSAYCELIVKTYADLVDRWITINEPGSIYANYGLAIGAPGRRECPRIAHQTLHHALLAHGYAVAAVRAHGRPGSQVGVVHNPTFTIPAIETPENIEAARKLSHRDIAPLMDPFLKGCYPPWWLDELKENAPQCTENDMKTIGAQCDWFGLNIYSGMYGCVNEAGAPEKVSMPPAYPRSDVGWQCIVPDALYWAVRFTHELYSPGEIHISESGLACKQEFTPAGEVHDVDRIQYLRHCLRALQRATREGYPVAAYFHWTMFDNYEWIDGYSKKFGLVAIRDGSLERVPKLSAKFYRQVIAENAVV